MGKEGFTLIEIIVVLAIISILAAVLTPIAVRQIDESRLTAARSDTRALATAIVNFHINTKVWPVYADTAAYNNSNEGIDVLKTADGEEADAGNNRSWLSEPSDLFKDQLSDNETEPEYSGWKGPYIGEIKADPWGRKYYAGVGSIFEDWGDGADPPQAWVISSGPDGNIDTNPNGPLNDDPLGGPGTGDDIGFLVSGYAN